MENNNFDLDALLGQVNMNGVSAESTGYQDLPSGYYLCEVESAELGTSKSSGLPQVKMVLKVIQNGIIEVTDEEGNVYLSRAKGTKNRKIYKYYSLDPSKDFEKAVKTVVSDLLKFEGDTPGVELLGEILRDEEGKLITPSTALLQGSLEAIQGFSIYVKSDTQPSKKNPQEKTTFSNLIGWARAEKLHLLEVPSDEE